MANLSEASRGSLHSENSYSKYQSFVSASDKNKSLTKNTERRSSWLKQSKDNTRNSDPIDSRDVKSLFILQNLISKLFIFHFLSCARRRSCCWEDITYNKICYKQIC